MYRFIMSKDEAKALASDLIQQAIPYTISYSPDNLVVVASSDMLCKFYYDNFRQGVGSVETPRDEYQIWQV